ncbi:MAG TPA: hypothetical protein VK957_01080, partial [Lunatimonas sp.]|nr:hypothetical protein [Lunatimonas sp.]
MKINQKIIISLMIGLVTLGCVEDENGLEPDPTAVNFDQQTIDLALGQEPAKIKINLDQPAPQSGTVRVKLTGDATYGEDYETLPVTAGQVLSLLIDEGEEYIELSLLPKEGGKFDGEKTVLLKLETVSEGFAIGSMSQASITLKDEILGDEAKPAKVSFTSTTLDLQENQMDGADIKITLDGTVKPGSFITVKLITELGAYGSRFSVDPNPIEEEIRLFPQPGDSEITFKIRPVNDNQVLGDLTIQMSISQIGNHMEIGDEDELLLTIKEDDQAEIPETHSVAELRDKFLAEGDWYLPQDYFIQGIITSHENVIQNAVYIQDETAGILIRFTGSNLLKRGDHV